MPKCAPDSPSLTARSLTGLCASPHHTATRVGGIPASGPAMPTSKSTRRVRIRCRRKITAPNVPSGESGKGRKYGRLARTR